MAGWRIEARQTAHGRISPIESISRKSSSKTLGGCGTAAIVGFVGIFVVSGVAIGYFVSIRPLYRAWQAQSWTATPCEVISSRVVAGDDTARADIVYKYQAGDREYTSNRYNFLPGTNSDSTTPAVVRDHPPGKAITCYVDPMDPSEAVLNRAPTRWYYFGLVFMVMFAGIPGLVAGSMFYFNARERAAHRNLSAAFAPGTPTADPRFARTMPAVSVQGPTVLAPSASPVAKLIGATIACLVWNSIVGVFTYVAFDSGGGFGCMAIVLLLFQLIGLALIVAVPYQLLALANPRPLITLSAPSLRPGGSVAFRWELSGAAHRVKRLQLTLRGREAATYQHGTSTTTDSHEFFTQTIVDTDQALTIPRGSGTLRVPADTMHSFDAPNNKIIWTLQLTGEIARWPDVDVTFPITVLPS